MSHDPVNKPAHYGAGGIDVIDFIEAKRLDFHLGNVVKYVARHAHKGAPLLDLKKARWYLDRAIERLEAAGLAQEPADELADLQALAKLREVSWVKRQAVVEACAREDWDAARQLLAEQVEAKRAELGVPLDGK